jgi:hypothetical protein
MSGFNNPIVNAAGQLIRTLIKSANYVAGSLGWQITKDGNAEFNNGTFRGPLRITGPNNAVISIDATQPYPTMYFYSIDGTNYSQLSLINYASASAADFWISSGKWTPVDGVPRAARLFMAGAQSDLVYLGVARLTDGKIMGGYLDVAPGFTRHGYYNQAASPTILNYIQFQSNDALISAPLFRTPNTVVQIDKQLSMPLGARFTRDNNSTALAGDVGKGLQNYSIAYTSTGDTVAGAPFSAMIKSVQMTSVLWEAGRAYGVQIMGGFFSGTNACSVNFKLQSGTVANAGTTLWDYLWGPQFAGQVRAAPTGLAFVRRSPATSLVSDISLQFLNDSSAIGRHYADNGHPRGILIYDIGEAADYPFATEII